MRLLKNTNTMVGQDIVSTTKKELWDNWNIRFNLILEDDLILKGEGVVVPESQSCQKPDLPTTP